jgi:predicted Zn-dependent peptidase
MHLRRALVLALALFAPGVAHADDLSIPFTKSQLPNGVTVIFHEDHTLPVVVVNVSYDVGSHVEHPKRTGFAHLFEHLMFMGTRRAPPKTFDQWMEAAGGRNNAWTSEDRTDYFDVAPPTALPLLLWLEADRMRDIGPLMTKEKLDLQRDVVRNERRQSIENRPYGVAELLLPEMLYPPGHPYHHPVIGSHEDLEAATVDDVKDFFATWYDPANASLVVAGDFDPKTTMPLIEKWLGTLPSRGKPKDEARAAIAGTGDASTLTDVVRKTVEDEVQLTKVIFAWPSPRHFAPGDAELDLLSAILASGKAGRLYKSLVYDAKLAQSVTARQESGVLGSHFVVEVVARPKANAADVERAIEKEIDRVRTTDVNDEELSRAKNVNETAFVDHLQGVEERASLLNAYQAEVGDPGYVQRDLDRYRKATKKDLRAVAQRVLLPKAHVVLTIVPRAGKAVSQ